MLIGTSCRFSARFCAVTMISSSPRCSCAINAGHASRMAAAMGVRGMRRGTNLDLVRCMMVLPFYFVGGV